MATPGGDGSVDSESVKKSGRRVAFDLTHCSPDDEAQSAGPSAEDQARCDQCDRSRFLSTDVPVYAFLCAGAIHARVARPQWRSPTSTSVCSTTS